MAAQNSEQKPAVESLKGSPFTVGVLYKLSRTRACGAVVAVALVLMMGAWPAWAVQYLTEETLAVDGSGREVFTSLPLDPCCVYRVIISGTMQVSRWQVDARYWTDEAGNFTKSYNSITSLVSFIRDSNPNERLALKLIGEQRAAHLYFFSLQGAGERVSAQFDWGENEPGDSEAKAASLKVAIAREAPLPTGKKICWSFWSEWQPLTVLLAIVVAASVVLVCGIWIFGSKDDDQEAQRAKARRRADRAERRLKVAREAAEEKRRAQEAARERSQRAQAEKEQEEREAEQRAERARFNKLYYEYEKREHYEDPQFLDDHARKFRQSLLEQKDKIVREYEQLQSDEALIALLNAEAPHILRRAIWRMEALARAERLDVQEPPPRKRKTPEEYRMIMTAWERERARDKITKAKTKLENMLDAQKMLDQLEPMEPEDRERLERELREQILAEDDGNQGTIIGAPNAR